MSVWCKKLQRIGSLSLSLSLSGSMYYLSVYISILVLLCNQLMLLFCFCIFINLSPSEIKNDNSSKWSFIPDLCNDSFSPKIFQFYPISTSFFIILGYCLYLWSFIGFKQHISWKVILNKKYSNFSHDVFVFYSNALLHQCCIQYLKS